VFKRSAMPNIMEWMQTSADEQEREDFKKMHSLLCIQATANPNNITEAGVHVHERPVTPAEVVDEEAKLTGADPELRRLNEGLQAIQEDIYLNNLKSMNSIFYPPKDGVVAEGFQAGQKQEELLWTLVGSIINDEAAPYVAARLRGLSVDEKKTCWSILQKVAAAENNHKTYTDTSYNRAFVHNPYYEREGLRSDYSNLSTALALQKTYYPPGVEEPVLDLEAMDKRMAKMKEGNIRADQAAALNCMSVASAIKDRWHMNDSPPPTPPSQEKEYYYGNNMLRNNTTGGPHTTYTGMAHNPYSDFEALEAQRKHIAANGGVAPVISCVPRDLGGDLDMIVEEVEAATSSRSMRSSGGRGKPKPKVLTGTQALQASSIPLNLGYNFPKSTAAETYNDPVNRIQAPNAMAGGGVVNSHGMATACITGMAPMGLAGRPNKSGPPVVAPGFRKARPKTAGQKRNGQINVIPVPTQPSMAHQDFMRRMSQNKNLSGGTSSRSGGRPGSAHSARTR